MSSQSITKCELKNDLDIISRMENSKSCFICVECPNNFLFSTWEKFKLHHCARGSSLHFECIYCGLLVLWKHGERHVISHFKHISHNLYNCPHCIFSSNSEFKILKHTLIHEEMDTNVQIRCYGCDELFGSFEELIEHVKFNSIVIYNCYIANCFVKSRNKFQMCDHYKRIHPTKATNFEVNIILACSERTPDVVFTRQLVARVAVSEKQFANGIFRATSTQSTSGLYLECFRCDFSTSQWQSFIRHYFKCNLLLKQCNEKIHQVFICSACFTMSTKRHLVEEHLSNCARNAKIITEVLPPKFVQESVVTATNDVINKPSKRSRSLCSYNQEVPECKRSRINESPKSKCNTDEAVFPDFDDVDLNEDVVSISFDEVGFRSHNASIPCHKKDDIITKMIKFSQCQISIVGKENYGRIPECPDCHKVFTYGFGDFKRHYMTVHLEIEKEYIKECQKFTRLPKDVDKLKEMQEQVLMRNLRPVAIGKDKIRVPLPYSIMALKRLTKSLPLSTQQYLYEKMKVYGIMSIIIHNIENGRRFLCHQCSYSSPYALADVRKHILGSHCGISTKHFRYCLQVSRLDPNQFILLTDKKLLNLARELSQRTKKKRLSASNPLSTASLSSDQAEVLSPPPVVEVSSTKKSDHSKSISSPEHNAHRQSSRRNTKTSRKSQHSHPVVGRKASNATVLDADSNFNLSLPYSENVLETLLQTVIESKQISSIKQKMKVYANYNLTRLCKNDRTVAFQCPCGRVFHTSRVPDLKMRAATLADARRHVMGVHAKIPQSLITICCQASRICRENDFQLYSDEMLLQLAAERQGKLPDSRSNGPMNDSSSKSQDYEEISPILTVVALKNSFLTTSKSEEVACPVREASPTIKKEDKPLESATWRLDCESSKIERVIHLPYSIEALRSLTDGYCEPSFFAVLQEKMEIYTKYIIFIIRQEGRRIFCCSGCLSSSPHGMGDVKKHILGVHARIPERFKAAAMHCSRLSREDTSLLPDHLLLQLAEMKWKGSIIKPLSELTVEERIKKFGKKNGEGKLSKLRLNSNYSMLEWPLYSNNGKDDEHEDEEEGSGCSSDDVGMVEEGCHVAAGGDSEIIVPEDFFVIVENTMSVVNYKCSVCDYESRFVGNAKGHIVREHLGIPTHSCNICEQLFNNRASVLAHHERDHQDSTLPFTLAHYEPYKIAISRLSVKEFTADQLSSPGALNGYSKRNSFLQHSQEDL